MPMMDWSKFTFDYRLVLSDLYADFVAIEASKEAAKNLVLPPDWREQLDRLNRIRAVHGTTALEGNPLSEAEVSRQIEIAANPNEAAKQAATKEQRQIRNAGRAQDWVRSRFTGESRPIDLDDIFTLHKFVTEASDEKNNVPGQLRTFPVQVGTPALGGVHIGAPHERLPRMMRDYVEFINSRRMRSEHSVLRALLAHFFLVTLHPFGDGNGRVSRLVEAAILFQGGYNDFGFYGLSNYFYRNEAEYKTTLQACRMTQPFEVSPFVSFGLRGFASELKGINNFIKAKLNRVVYRTTLVRALDKKSSERRRVINRREYDLLDYLIVQTEPVDPFSDNPSRRIELAELLESPFVRQVYKSVTARTLHRELVRLAETGFIKFTRREGKDGKASWIVELDFAAIGKY